MIYRLTEGQLDPPADPYLVEGLSSSLGLVLPCDYLDFLRQHDGGEGFLGENYVIFWKASELADFNREYEVEKYAPGIFLFGSSGGGEGYGFDMELTERLVVQIPFIGMDRRLAIPVAKNFPDLFAQFSSSQ
ncbi:SMI1/KNR4 family protein [Pseudoxanthomonas broegbernensis]|uniref:SMI1/KNR4 family protein n=1 Tax=Pseudoxanthomonas broegbernensis TaxID=83619 RepID=A0A7V8K5N9_9GAMM|nr:SMI1/KNR4 family protein [Pseudoxanthomonas broegbernensis]KAF1684583.1 SMI1/KNR4 family protein [Pseudoxanthomonas broegbernensis]MBB6066473.1 hypothetical protein [Pseudoxanthomonas broegbernensis]